jgi:hypothetical protein
LLATFGVAGPAVAAPDFQLTVSPKTVFLAPGGSVQLTIGATGMDGFSSPVTLQAMNLPAGVSASFSVNPLVLPGTSTLTLTAGAALVVEEFNVNVAATGGGITHFALNGVNTLDFDLQPAVVEPPPCEGTVHGTLKNSETLAPIANSPFRIGFFRGTTDANGNYGPFQFTPGDYQFFADEIPGYWPKRQPVTLSCSGPTRLDYALLPWHPATVHGKVVEGTPSPSDSTVVIPTTTPISGVPIRLEGHRSDGAPSASDGSYTTNVPFLGENNTSVTNVRLFPEAVHLKGYWPRSSNYPSPISIGDLAPFDDKLADVALVRQCFGKISGTVTYGDGRGPAGGVNVKASHGYAQHDVVTAANGTYTIDKALLGYNNIPVDHSVIAFASTGHPYQFYYFTSDPVKTHLDVCGRERVVNIVLPPIPMGHIDGHVYDDDGELVAGAKIGIAAPGCRPCVHTAATSDANGYYRISDIPAPSTWPVHYFDQFRTPFWESPSLSVDVTAGRTTERDIHIVRKRFASVTGTVRDAVTGEPIEGVSILETDAQEAPPPSTATALDGSYLLGPLGLRGNDNSSRTTAIEYTADGYWLHEETLTLEKDKPPYLRDVDLIPVCRGVVVTGVVRHAVTGATIPFARVETDQFDVVQADEFGVYRFEDIDVGSKNSPTELVITASADNLQPQTKTVEIFCGSKVAVGSAGTITIEKATEPSGDTTKFDFDGELGTFSLADGETETASGLFPGTYDVSETAVPGWHLRDVSCNEEPIEPVDEGLFSIDVGPGETVHCVFTNTKPGTIIIEKETLPDGDATAFEFFGPEEDSFTLGDGQSHTIPHLAPGSYLVSENLIGPWEVESVTCDDEDSGVDEEFGPGDLAVELSAGETVTCTYTNRRVPTGTVVIKKETDPDGELTTFDFFGPDVEFTLADGEEQEIADLSPGSYQISEFAPEGWSIDRVECDDEDSGADPESPETVMLEVAADEIVTCTFFNKELEPETGTIIVEKTTDPTDDPTEFSFSSEELGAFALSGGGAQSFTDLTPGLYGVTEDVVADWTLESATCDDGSTVDSIDVEAGETVTCTFNNVASVSATGTIIIAKTTDPAGDATSFEFLGDLGPFALADGDSHEAEDLPVGSYSVTESTATGWDLASATCTDGSTVDAITLEADETVTCTFHNVQQGTLQIRKVGIGGSGSFDFTTASAGAQPIEELPAGSASQPQSVPPGDYVFTEAAVDGWDVSDVTCDDGNSARPSTGDRTARTASFAIEAGESVICTFTNTKRGTLTITKETDPASDPQDFAFTPTGDGLSPFSLDTDSGNTAFPASRSFVLTPGTYSVSETLPESGWDFTRVSCTSASGQSVVPAASTSSSAVTLTLAAGDVVTCTYRNTKRASFEVVKTVAGQPLTSIQVFDFEVRSGASPSILGTTLGVARATAANGGLASFETTTTPATPLLVAPGTYQFCEFILPGWGNPLGASSFVPGLALDSTADNAFLCVDVTVAAGAVQTFTLDNRPPPGGQAKTIGFWKNWASCSKSSGKQKPVLDQTLATLSGGVPVGRLGVSTCPVAVDLLNKLTVGDRSKVGDGRKMASDPAFNFAAQYLAFRLNIAANANSGCLPANSAAATGQSILLAIRFDGQTRANPSKSDASRLNAAAAVLDRYNNNTLIC